jgi:hypothetical protein
MKKLFLHAGTHKTGTTAIQTFAANHRYTLAARGLIYPDYHPLNIRIADGHHAFGHAFSDTPKSMTVSQAQTVVRKWGTIAESTDLPLLVSVEAVYRHVSGAGTWQDAHLCYLNRVADSLMEFDVEVILVFRRPDAFVRSMYIENITTGIRVLEDFSDWLSGRVRYLAEYAESARAFENVFGKIRCLLYEDLIEPPGLVPNFFSELGIDVSDLEGGSVVRSSITCVEASIKNYANTLGITKKVGRQLVEWLKGMPAQELIDKYYSDKNYDVWQSAEQQRAFLHSRAADLMLLSDRYFSGRQLFDLAVPDRTISPLPPVPEEVARHVRNIVEGG